MNDSPIEKYLRHLSLGGLRYFENTTSTNDDALTWAAQDAQDFSLVAANQQSQGRGRLNRQWITQPGGALAFSLIVRPDPSEMTHLDLFPAWAALGICTALDHYDLHPEIKWPNDVLLNRRKAAGILAETSWTGGVLTSLVIGIGINVHHDAVPADELVRFPATSVEQSLSPGKWINRWILLAQILEALLFWRKQIGLDSFLHAWDYRLAFRNEWIQASNGFDLDRAGKILGLDTDGSLRLLSPEGEIFSIQAGEISLRPTQPDSPK